MQDRDTDNTESGANDSRGSKPGKEREEFSALVRLVGILGVTFCGGILVFFS